MRWMKEIFCFKIIEKRWRKCCVCFSFCSNAFEKWVGKLAVTTENKIDVINLLYPSFASGMNLFITFQKKTKQQTIFNEQNSLNQGNGCWKKSLILMEKKYKNRKRNYTEIYKQKMEKKSEERN